MKTYIQLVAGLSLVSLSLGAVRLHGQQTDPAQHEQHHSSVTPATADSPQTGQPSPPGQSSAMMARMRKTDAHLDALVKKMNAATGAAKIDAIAELLTALVEDRREHESMMGGMASKMSKMQGRQGDAQATPAK